MPLRPGTPVQQQAGGIYADLQQSRLTGARQHGFHHVLHLGEGANIHQIAVGGLLGKILLTITRQAPGIDEAFLQLQWLAIGLMDDQAVKDGGANP